MNYLDDTHDPALKSWVESANDPATEFPIQNLPFGRFREKGTSGSLRIGVAIGDQILDLAATGLIDTDDMNSLMAANPDVATRRRVICSVPARCRDPMLIRQGRCSNSARAERSRSI